MYKQIHYYICDECNAISVKSSSWHNAIQSAEGNGWIIEEGDLEDEDRKDFCPICAQELASSPA